MEAGEGQPSPVAVLQALVRVTFQYWYERQGSEPEHRDRVFEENGTRCVYGEFLAALERCHELWLQVERLPVQEPPSAPPKPEPRRTDVLEDYLPRPRDIVMQAGRPDDV